MKNLYTYVIIDATPTTTRRNYKSIEEERKKTKLISLNIDFSQHRLHRSDERIDITSN